MSVSCPSKTPVSLLQELAAKQGVTPKYDLLQVEGAVHEPTFLYRATMGDLVASGQGQSKKKAKHMAARAVLDQLLGQTQAAAGAGGGSEGAGPAGALPPSEASLLEAASQLPTANYDDGIAGNPVGQLQEVCMSRRWPPPVYEIVTEEGLPHERTFTIACCIGTKSRQIGIGKSKKIAKRQASSKMLEKLQEAAPSEGVSLLDNDDDEIARKMTAHYSGMRDGWLPRPAGQQAGVRVSQFHSSLKTSDLPLINQLRALPLDSVSPVRHLKELAQEQNFDVTWVEIEEATRSGRRQCLVQLSTLPVAVCYGSGDDAAAAQTDAARNALQYLQTVVQRPAPCCRNPEP